MKLFYAPGACSLAPHIVAREASLAIELEKVDLASKKTETGRDYTTINPKGYVPALLLDDGSVMTEAQVLVQYLADQKPGASLVPAHGTLARYRLQERLAFISTEIHKSYSPLFKPTTPDATRQDRLDYLGKRYAAIDGELAGRDWLDGERFTVADAYLFTVTNWSRHVKLDLSANARLLAWQKRVAERPAVQAAMKAEGLGGR